METAKTDRPIKKENAMEGNQMKMREALIELRKSCQNWIRFGTIHKKTFEIYIDLIDVALSAPARNCDVEYADQVEMYDAFKDWCRAKGHTMEPMLAYDAFDWLLAPAADRKQEVRT